VHKSVRPAVALLWGLTVAVAAAAAVFLVLGPGRALPEDLLGGISGAAWLTLALAFATVGALIVSRLPGHRVGWLFAGLGLLIALNELSYSYATWGLYAQRGEVPGLTVAPLGWGQPIAPLLGLSLLLFPDGHLPSRRWRPVAAMSAVAILGFVATVLRPGPFDVPFDRVSNALGVPGMREAINALNGACWMLTYVALGLGVRALALRLRGARGDERQQLKWVLTVSTVVGAVTVVLMGSWFIWPENVQWRMAVLGGAFIAFPLATGVAILRHRLYDIDVVINRALVYGTLTATLAGAYLGGVLVLQLVLRPLTQESSLAIAASTLAVAALFRPARSRIQAVVDRRFYRRKYDAARTHEAFSARLREEVDLDSLAAQLREVVGETMQPAHVSLWLRPPERRT
jgi:hypothetical protein